LEPFSSFFVSRTRDAAATFRGYVRGLFQSERANMLRMSEVNEVDHQAMQHLLTEGCVDWGGFSEAIAREVDALLGGPTVSIHGLLSCRAIAWQLVRWINLIQVVDR